MLEKLNLFHLTGRITSAIDVITNKSVLKKMSFKMLGLCLSSKLDWESYIVSFTKTASQKIRALICSMKFLSPWGYSLSL